MSQAYFEGSKQYIPVAPHLVGLSAVGNPTKITYHLLGAAISFIPYFLGLGSTFLASEAGRDSAGEMIFTIIGILFLLLFFILPIVNLVLILLQGRTLPMALLKVRAVDVRTGKTATGMLFLKILLEGLISYFSLGIGFIIIAFASQDELGRTWFDRTASTMMISTTRGRDPHAAPVLAAPSPVGYPEPAVNQQAPLYGQATYGQAPSGQTEYGQPQYDHAQYSQTQYGQPQYAHTSYGQTQQAQPAQSPYGAPQPGQTPYGQTAYTQSTPPQPPYGQASQEQSSYAQGPFAQPSQAPFTNGSPYAPPTTQMPGGTPDPTSPYEKGHQI